jgi:2-polyprenyl-3-methyl-5-hydroxy-6-metoxy-1,4-benzoquinol methylase
MKTVCPFCESTKSEVSFRDHGYDKRDYAIVKCKDCEFKFISPLPDNTYLAEIYASYYGKGQEFKETAKQLAYRLPVFESLCDMIEKKKNKTSTLLDIGCGNGDFIWLAQKRGWDVRGIELSQTAVDFAVQMRNLEVVLGASDQLPYEDNSFDVVTVLDVLEHLSNPAKVLESIFRVLKPGGALIVQVPNTPFQIFKARAQKLKNGKKATTMATPLHLNHFDGNSLSNFAKHAQFNIEKIFPGFADSAGPGLGIKRAYVRASRLLWKVTGLQAGHSLCMVATKLRTADKQA